MDIYNATIELMVEINELALGLILLSVLFISEFLTIKVGIFWQLRKLTSVVNSALLGLSSSLIIINQPVWIKLFIGYLALIHLTLILRMAGGKVNQIKNKRLSTMTAFWLYISVILFFTMYKFSSIFLIASWLCLIILVLSII